MIKELLEGFAVQPGPNEFQCALCKGIFEKGWSDEEAAKECQEKIPEFAGEPVDVVCEDCYQKMMKEIGK